MIRRAVTRTCLALGVQGVVLPLATLVSFAVAGARLAGSAGTGGERTVSVLGLRLVAHLPAVSDGPRRLLRGPGPRDRGRPRPAWSAASPAPRRRFRSSRAGVISSRARARARHR